MLRLFDFKCSHCGSVQELMVDHTDKFSKCSLCGRRSERMPPVVRAAMGASGAYGYYDDNLQTYIHTNRQRRDEMKRQGVSEKVGKGWY